MGRRASSGISPAVIVGVVVVIALVAIGGKFMLGEKKSSWNIDSLDVDELLQNGNILYRNEYEVSGEVDEKLKISDKGQLVSVKIDGPKGDEFIGIMIPPKFDKLNISTRQKFRFRVKFKQGGIAIAEDIERL